MDLVTVISFIVLLAALLLPVLAHMLRRHPRWFATAKYVIFGAYVAANLYATLLFRTSYTGARVMKNLLWSYKASLRFPDGLMSLFRGTVEVVWPDMLEQIILNVLLYIPMGYLLPAVFERLKFWQVILIGFVCSLITEVSQLIFKIGMFEYDDILNNTLGCIIGLIMFLLIVRRRIKREGHEAQSNDR